MNLMLRRRLLSAKPDILDNPYISDGLVFWLDGINKGKKAGYWTDLIGGYDFQIPSGVSSISDGMVFSNPHDEMKHIPQSEKLATPWQSATVEVVCTYQQSQSFPWCSSYNGGTCFCFYGGTIGINMGYVSNPQFKVPSDISEDGTLHTFSVTASDCYADLVQLTQQGNTYFSTGLQMNIGCRGNGSWYYGTIKSIRIYSRQLTYAERLANAQIDDQRFNLGLNL